MVPNHTIHNKHTCLYIQINKHELDVTAMMKVLLYRKIENKSRENFCTCIWFVILVLCSDEMWHASVIQLESLTILFRHGYNIESIFVKLQITISISLAARQLIGTKYYVSILIC